MPVAEVPDMASLTEWRLRLKISRERVMGKLGMSAKTLQRWEREQRDPGEVNRRRLANLYADAEQRPEEFAA